MFELNKIIYIISDEKDQTTNKIFEWLIHYKKQFRRIQSNNQLGEILNSYLNQELNSIYYRKPLNQIDNVSNDLIEVTVKEHLNEEFNDLIDYLFSRKEIKTLGEFGLYKLNRLKVLKIAKKCGLVIPNFCIVNTKTELLLFFQKLKNPESVIIKSISDGVSLNINGKIYGTYTEELFFKNLNIIPDDFMPMLIMETIVKIYEIRIFYLCGKFYSVCIFTQNNTNTKVDSRRAENSYPNRIVPYKLPVEIESKLVKVFNKLNINTGSVDLLYNTRGEYIFLEINPCGQFQMNSNMCNYYLEREIAKFLINE
ncbi:MAG TPA: grasp-with-spasm system ATP-grasp peptide maturase [Saprospiraceae bacterium]|nr:grasp-with-spasm system ATP-grasp peptide maturase [Saprospiraceae bacterium]